MSTLSSVAGPRPYQRRQTTACRFFRRAGGDDDAQSRLGVLDIPHSMDCSIG